jgi:hypothetical protein
VFRREFHCGLIVLCGQNFVAASGQRRSQCARVVRLVIDEQDRDHGRGLLVRPGSGCRTQVICQPRVSNSKTTNIACVTVDGTQAIMEAVVARPLGDTPVSQPGRATVPK